MKKFGVLSICVLGILLMCLTGCDKGKENPVHDKLDAELAYDEDLIFKIAIQHAKSEYEEDGKINWDYIKGDVQRLNSSWNNLILDLTVVNVQNKDIVEFSNNLNNLLISISKENEIAMLDDLNAMYDKVILFREAYSENKNLIKRNKIKSSVLNGYILVTQNEWENAKTKLDSTIEEYKELMNNQEYVEENRYNLNKIYISLQELRNSLETQNYDLIKLKYILTVEEL